MKEKYIFMGIILILAYIVISMIEKAFRKVSDGNSIKQEEKLAFEKYSFLIEGIFCIFSIYLVSKFEVELKIPLFYIQIGLTLIIFLDFFKNFIKAIGGYVAYSAAGSMWSIIGAQFIKVIVIAYLVFNYFTIYIQ